MGLAHARFETAHAGWSFPARIMSPALPLAALTPARRLVEARARGYAEDCAPAASVPGTFCERRQRVVPRQGGALEPLQLGLLLGPDAELRTHLPLAEAPRALVDAILVSEDRDFRSHRGVNFSALVRASLANTRDGAFSQGGSTLTMQVVRSLSQRTEKTVWRKLREMALAQGLEAELGKDGVLQMYLDAPYLGQRGSTSICGFSEAARHYFGRDVRALDLAQIATLVAILPGPGKLAPDRNPSACLTRRNLVLRELARRYDYDVRDALEAPLGLSPSQAGAEPQRYPAFLSVVRAELEAALPREQVYGAGLVVETSIDLVMQREAESLFPEKTQLYEHLVGAKPGTLQTVGVALDVDTGLIRAVYGGRDASVYGFSRATQAHRQPGSSFKPLVYALAFSARNRDGSPTYTAASTQPNSPREFRTPTGTWSPTNVGGESSPSVSLAEGLAWSKNIATASLLERLGGARPLIELAGRAGFDTRAFPDELGLALGQAEVTPLEMAQLAGLVANGGRRLRGTPVVRATDGAGAVRIAPPQRGPEVLEPRAALLTRELMRLVVDYGTGGGIRGAGGEPGYSGPAIGKTGTTDYEKDLWFVGATPKTAAVVWVGFDRPARVGASAADLAAPLWGWWMARSAAHSATPLPDFPKEPPFVRRGICAETGQLPSERCRVVVAPFLPGTVPTASCTAEHAEPEEEAGGGRGRPAYEGLWKRKAREADAREGSEAPERGERGDAFP